MKVTVTRDSTMRRTRVQVQLTGNDLVEEMTAEQFAAVIQNYYAQLRPIANQELAAKREAENAEHEKRLSEHQQVHEWCGFKVRVQMHPDKNLMLAVWLDGTTRKESPFLILGEHNYARPYYILGKPSAGVEYVERMRENVCNSRFVSVKSALRWMNSHKVYKP